jgi:flagellin
MAAILSTNMASLYAQKNLSTAQASLSESVQRLSSGTRINSAKDDAAGYGISEQIRGNKNIVDQGIRNVKDGISWAQTAEGALDVVGKILQRALTLTTQAQNATLSAAQFTSIGKELQELSLEVTNIAARTKFQASAILSTAGVELKVATGATATTDIDATMVDLTDFDTFAGLIAAGDAGVPADIEEVQLLINANATNRAALGAGLNSLEYALDNMQTLSTNMADSISRIVDTDYAAETSNLTRTQILQQAATSMLAQANQMPNVILTLLK